MVKKQGIIFSIVAIFFCGIVAGMASSRILPVFFGNFKNISTAFKTALLFVLLIYLVEIILTIIGSYLLLTKNKVNLFLFWLTIMFSLVVSINQMNFTFFPFDLHISFRWNIGDISFGFGPNFIGILFIIWWVRLEKKSIEFVDEIPADNIPLKIDGQDRSDFSV